MKRTAAALVGLALIGASATASASVPIGCGQNCTYHYTQTTKKDHWSYVYYFDAGSQYSFYQSCGNGHGGVSVWTTDSNGDHAVFLANFSTYENDSQTYGGDIHSGWYRFHTANTGNCYIEDYVH